MQKLLLITIALLWFQGVTAQTTGSLRGRVINENKEPIPFATVLLKSSNYGTATDERGNFRIAAPAGKYKLSVSGIGFSPVVQPIVISEGAMLDLGTIELLASEEELNEVTIHAIRNGYKVDNPSPSLRLNEPLVQVPQNIQVVTAEALADQQVIFVTDGLTRNVSGATQFTQWGNLYAQINMRGSRASAFRNGMNVTSNFGPLTEEMSFVSEIEFVKGPAGFMMSYGEPSGIYNVVTKKPTGQSGGNVGITLGSFDLYRGTLDIEGKLDKKGKLLYRFNAMGQTQNSFQKFRYQDRFSIAPVISYQLDDKTKLSLEYIHQHVTMSNMGDGNVFTTKGYAAYDQSFTVSEPGLDPTTIEDRNITANLQHQINSNWKFTAQLSYFNYSQEGNSLWIRSIDNEDNMLRYASIWDAQSNSTFGQAYLNGKVQTGAISHTILAGLDLGTKEYYADFYSQINLDTPESLFQGASPVYGRPANGLPVFDRSKTLHNRANNTYLNQTFSGVYLQDELGFLKNDLRLTLAGRYTYVYQVTYGSPLEDTKLSPRLGLSYSLDKNTSIYGLYDQSFVPQSGIIEGGESPKPITGNNMELGLKRDFFEGKWSTSLSAYRILKNNQLVSDPDDATGIFSLELGQTRTQGIEFDARGKILPGLVVTANYAYTDSEITEDINPDNIGNGVPGFATHVANTWISYSLTSGALKGLGISMGFMYQGDRHTWRYEVNPEYQLPDYFKLDGGLSWKKNQLELRANVFNILDEYLYMGASYSGFVLYQAEAPRNSRFSVAYSF
ncbi:ferrichrome-iron receptor [Echinicola pacifica]|uniref:Ferrichrome-iron receptor n=1 Tax=Echinicola pacifica TaxID=346377 RepID=A0A918UTK6_9BACT|nr:TonB-dependent receptor [Echinicola pacifica]GGZ32217.1 ferrichrome-iron receptor [Echinicola pacifica]